MRGAHGVPAHEADRVGDFAAGDVVGRDDDHRRISE
jgi:hypothetical protein